MLPLLHGFLSSDAKAMATAVPVRAGLDAYLAATAGLHGSADILEHPKGFLARFADVALPEMVTSGLGSRWHTETLAFKLRPGAPTVDAAVDCAVDLCDRVNPDDILEIVVITSLYSMLIEQAAVRYMDGPRTPTAALAFNTPYCIATALLTGNLTAADFAAPAVDDARRWSLATKVRIQRDDDMTRDSLRCSVPLGEALRHAGDRAAAWLTEIGTQWLVDLVGPPDAPCESFKDAARVSPARIVITLRDGSIIEQEQTTPVGSPGSVNRAEHQAQVRRKFLATGGLTEAADIAAELDTATPEDVRRMLDLALEFPVAVARIA
jgi:2-methylcitrate dehydratase PrpD